MARISRNARIARNRPQEATCIESTSGRSSLACMLGTQHDDGPTDTTRAHNTSTLVLVVRHRDTTLPRAGTHTHHATPPPRHTTDTRARTTQDPSDARMRGSHSPHLMSAFSSSSQSRRTSTHARTHRPQEATCIESTSGRSSLACMLGTQMTMGRQTRRVRTTRALWFWWSGIGTQPFHELAHTHTTLHHHLATRRTHAHAQHKILATHGCEGLTLHT